MLLQFLLCVLLIVPQGSLRRRFANAMQWYSALVNESKLRMNDYIDGVKGLTLPVDHEPSELLISFNCQVK